MHIAQFWGLLDAVKTPAPRPRPVRVVQPPQPVLPVIEDTIAPQQPPLGNSQVENIILRALKAAGLIKKR
jgi:hypothetical protein